MRDKKLILVSPTGPRWVRLSIPQDAPRYEDLLQWVRYIAIAMRLERDDNGIHYIPALGEDERTTERNAGVVREFAETLATMPMGTWHLIADVA